MSRIYNNTLPLLENFRSWGEVFLGKGTMNNYCSWLKDIPNDIKLPDSSPLHNYLRIIGTHVRNGQVVVAKTILTQVINKFEDHIGKNGLTTKLRNDRSAINCYKDYISHGVLSLRSSVICKGDNYSTEEELNKVTPSKSECEKFDSMEILLSEIGESKFIKLVIESCLFFDKNMVITRFNEIKSAHNQSSLQALPARWSTNENYYTSKQCSSNKEFIKEFKDGKYAHDVIINGGPKELRKKPENRDVERLITNHTGYSLAGKNAIIRNYIISHIWGNASDPRFFTNFWNIVLVPAWADFLLPKSTSSILVPRSVASRLTATIMEICNIYYNMNSFDWHSINLDQPQNINPNDILRNKTNIDYSIQIICEKNQQNKLGAIKRETIHI